MWHERLCHFSQLAAAMVENARELRVSRVIPLKDEESEAEGKQAGWHNFISVPRRERLRRMADVRQLQGVRSSRGSIALKFT